MKELIDKIEELKLKIEDLKNKVNLQSKEEEIKNLEAEMNQESFWHDQNRAKDISQKVADLKDEIKNWTDIEKEVAELFELAKEDDKDQSTNLNKEIENQTKKLIKNSKS